MRTNQARSLRMFRRVRELLTTDSIDPAIAKALAELDGVITRFTQHGIDQETLRGRTRSLTVTLGEHARVMQRDLMRPSYLAVRAADPAHGRDGVALRRALRMPRHLDDYEALRLAAHAFAKIVDEHATVFAGAGLPPNTGARLREAAEAMLGIIDVRAKAEQQRIAATQGLAVEARRGAAIVRLLDALVEPTLRADAARLAEWRMAARVWGRATSAASDEAEPSESAA